MRVLKAQLSYFFNESRLRRNVLALVRYFAFLAAIVGLCAVGFQAIMVFVEGRDYSWTASVYWVLSTMSTLGLGDIVFESDVGRVYTALVLIAGIVLLLVMLPFVFVNFFYAPWLGAHVRLEAPRRVPPNRKGHVLITQHDSLSTSLIRKLRVYGIPYHVIEADAARAAELVDIGLSVLNGRPDRASTWDAARAADARLVVVNGSDEVNTNTVLTIRHSTPDVPIVAVVDRVHSVGVLELAGSDRVLPLKQRLGEQLANRVSARHAEARVIGSILDLKIAEFPVHSTPLVGKRIRDLVLREVLGVNVVAVWQRARLKPVHPDLVLDERSVVVVAGTEAQLAALNAFLIIYDTNESPVVVIGGGVVGCATASALRRAEIPVNLVEVDPRVAARVEGVADRLIVGDAADRAIVEQAGLLDTPSTVITTNNDDLNLYLTVCYRRLRPDLRIVSRLTHEENVAAMCGAGADFVLSSSTLGSEAILSFIQHREMVILGEGTELLYVPLPRALEHRTLAESGIASRSGLNVIGVEKDGVVVSNPPPATRLEPGSTLIALGTAAQLDRFTRVFSTRKWLLGTLGALWGRQEPSEEQPFAGERGR